MALQLAEELVGNAAVVVDEGVGVGEDGALGGVVGAVAATLQAGMWVICSSGISSSRIDLACWLKTNWLPAAHPTADLAELTRLPGSRTRVGDW